MGEKGTCPCKDQTLDQQPTDLSYKVPIFLSYASPFNDQQAKFLLRVEQELSNNLLLPRTLGVTDQWTEAPLPSIRRIVLSSYGLLSVAFRRAVIYSGAARPGTPREVKYSDQWLTSPYIQVEPSMAYQAGQPIMIIKENGIISDGNLGGILEQGVAPLFIPTFSVDTDAAIDAFFDSTQWKNTFAAWVGQVRLFYSLKTQPYPCIFECI